jgi:hypothetical protein
VYTPEEENLILKHSREERRVDIFSIRAYWLLISANRKNPCQIGRILLKSVARIHVQWREVYQVLA